MLALLLQWLAPGSSLAEDDPGRGLTLAFTVPEGPFNLYDIVPLTVQVTNIVSPTLSNVQLHLPPSPDIYYLSGPGIPEEGSPYTTLDLGSLEGGASLEVALTARIEGLPSQPVLARRQAMG